MWRDFAVISVLTFAFNAVAPILLQVALGYMLKRTGLFTKEFLRIANRFNFHYCLSVMLFCNIYSLDSVANIDWRMALFVLAALAALTLLGLLLARFATSRRDRRGVLAQAAFRSNFAIIGLPVVAALGTPGALATAAAMQAPSVIYFNLMAVVVLTVYSEGEKGLDWRKMLAGIGKNPLIRGLGLGFLALCLREFIPRTADGALVFSLSGSLPWLYSAMQSVSRIATPLALIVLGGQFEFGDMRTVGRELILGTAVRLLGAPAVGFALAFAAAAMGFIDISAGTVGVLIAIFGTPTAVSSVVMAGEMGADDVLAGQLVVWTTLGSVFTLFIIIAGFRFVGLL